jgi:hypothetical protein
MSSEAVCMLWENVLLPTSEEEKPSVVEDGVWREDGIEEEEAEEDGPAAKLCKIEIVFLFSSYDEYNLENAFSLVRSSRKSSQFLFLTRVKKMIQK